MKKLIIVQLFLTGMLTAEQVVFYFPALNKGQEKIEYSIDVQGKTVGDLRRALEQKFNTELKKMIGRPVYTKGDHDKFIFIAKNSNAFSPMALPSDLFKDEDLLTDNMEKWVGAANFAWNTKYQREIIISNFRIIAEGMKLSSITGQTLESANTKVQLRAGAISAEDVERYISWIDGFNKAIQDKNISSALSNLIMFEGILWYHISDESYLESFAQKLTTRLGEREKNENEGKNEDARSYLMRNLERFKKELKYLMRPASKKSVTFSSEEDKVVVINNLDKENLDEED